MRIKSLACLALFLSLALLSRQAYSHCDTMDGPVVADAKRAIEQKNVNFVLKWVKPEHEAEVSEAFRLIMNVKDLSPEAKLLAEKYFFETIVRLHRTGEGMPFTGIKPSGTPIDEKILAADKAIESGSLTPLAGLVPADRQPELKERFEKVLARRSFDVNDVNAGRAYIDAYVQFFHYAEGEGEHHPEAEEPERPSAPLIAWLLAGLFCLTALIFGILLIRRRSGNK